MAKQCYLGIDLGAESGRVMAGLFDGETISLKELHRFTNGPVALGGTIHWDVLRLWSEIQVGIAKGAAEYGDAIASIGVDTWGVDYVLCSKSGQLLGQPYHYRDSRTKDILADAFHRVPRREIFAATGLQFLEFNTLFQLLAMQRTDGPLLKLAERLMMMPDFFHWCLCGSRVTEFTNATTTQCFDPTSGDWAYDLLRKFELPTEIFPEVVAPGTRLGPLRNEVAQSAGCRRVEVVASATHDTGAAVAAVPTEQTGRTTWAYISSGTWSLMGVEVPRAVKTDRALELNVTNEGGVDGTFRLLKNNMGLWLLQECRRSFERQGRPLDYAELVHLAEKAPPFRSLIDPDDWRFLTPDDMRTAIEEACGDYGEPVPESEGQVIRCALESLALKYRTMLDGFEGLTGTKVEVIHIVGGGSRNALLNQFTANACARPVVAGPVEATVLGNVLVQVRAAGELESLADIRSVVRKSSELKQYEPADEAGWSAALERFKVLLSQRKA